MIELMRKRRSVRLFLRDPVSAEQRDIILEAMLRAPSAWGIQNWRLFVVEDRASLDRLSTLKAERAGFLAQAPLGHRGEHQR